MIKRLDQSKGIFTPNYGFTLNSQEKIRRHV